MGSQTADEVTQPGQIHGEVNVIAVQATALLLTRSRVSASRGARRHPCTPPTMSSDPKSRSARMSVWHISGLLIASASVSTTGLRLWNNTPCPATNPGQVGLRLKAGTKRLYADAGLPGTPTTRPPARERMPATTAA